MAFTRIDGDVYLVDAEGGDLQQTPNALVLDMPNGEWFFCNGDHYVLAFSESIDKDALQAASTRSVLSRGLDLYDLFLTRYLSDEQPTAALITVTGLGNEDPTTVTFTEEGKTFNWNFEEVTDEYGNIFVKIPTIYRKINSITDGQITSFSISDKKINDTYEPYPCFLDGNGNVLPYVLIGKYCSSSLYSINSVDAYPHDYILATGRTNARALGTGYQLYDWQIQKLFVDLALCHKKSVNFNGEQRIENYLGIYHLQHSIWVDGFYYYNGKWYAGVNPDLYISEPDTHPPVGYRMIGYSAPTSVGYIKSLGYDANNPFFNQPSDVAYDLTKESYYCDVFVYNDSESVKGKPVDSLVGGDSIGGLWYGNTTHPWTGYWAVRLCYRPISV